MFIFLYIGHAEFGRIYTPVLNITQFLVPCIDMVLVIVTFSILIWESFLKSSLIRAYDLLYLINLLDFRDKNVKNYKNVLNSVGFSTLINKPTRIFRNEGDKVKVWYAFFFCPQISFRFLIIGDRILAFVYGRIELKHPGHVY